jgi:hypothetical protein
MPRNLLITAACLLAFTLSGHSESKPSSTADMLDLFSGGHTKAKKTKKDSRDSSALYYLQVQSARIAELLEKRPELSRDYLLPAIDCISTLHDMSVEDHGYKELFDELYADMEAIDKALKNDWI